MGVVTNNAKGEPVEAEEAEVIEAEAKTEAKTEAPKPDKKGGR